MAIDENAIFIRNLNENFVFAREWCRSRLPRHFKGMSETELEYYRFAVNENVSTDNFPTSSAMSFDPDSGTVNVSKKNLEWYSLREQNYNNDSVYCSIPRLAKTSGGEIYVKGRVEVDPMSIFVHEITEMSILRSPEALSSCLSRNEDPHNLARIMENESRMERGLKPWPEY